MTAVPAGHAALRVTPFGAFVSSIEAVVATFVTFEIEAEVALVAFLALDTVPSVLSLILLPVTDRFCSRFPESEFFLISEFPLTSGQKAGKTGLSIATAIPRRAASASSTTAVSAMATPVRCCARCSKSRTIAVRAAS